MERKSILIVEDEGVTRRLLRALFEKDFDIYEAYKYSEVKNLPIYRIDLAIIDYVLPDTNGIHVLKFVREFRPLLPVIIMSAYTNETIVINALRAGATDYIRKPPDPVNLKRRVFEILYKENNNGDVAEDKTDRIKFILECVKEYLENNYHERHSRERLAEMAGINKYQLSKLFRRHFGMTIPEYINCIRIRIADGLLKNHDLSITEIAYHLGYESLDHFIRTFKKIHLLTPGEYRRKYLSP
jgi:YesN/AraC family two-component response regulator